MTKQAARFAKRVIDYIKAGYTPRRAERMARLELGYGGDVRPTALLRSLAPGGTPTSTA